MVSSPRREEEIKRSKKLAQELADFQEEVGGSIIPMQRVSILFGSVI